MAVETHPRLVEEGHRGMRSEEATTYITDRQTRTALTVGAEAPSEDAEMPNDASERSISTLSPSVRALASG